MEEIIDLRAFYYMVVAEAMKLGYTAHQVAIFEADIEDYFNNGKSVEQTISEVF